jgi:hypothetical protein
VYCAFPLASFPWSVSWPTSPFLFGVCVDKMALGQIVLDQKAWQLLR